MPLALSLSLLCFALGQGERAVPFPRSLEQPRPPFWLSLSLSAIEGGPALQAAGLSVLFIVRLPLFFRSFTGTHDLSADPRLLAHPGDISVSLQCSVFASSAEKHRATLQLSLPQVCPGEVAGESFDQASTGLSPSRGNAASTNNSRHLTDTSPVLRHLSGLHLTATPVVTVHLHGPGRNVQLRLASRSQAKGCAVRPAKFAALSVAAVNSAPSKLALASLVESRFELRLWCALAFEGLTYHLSAWAQRGIGERCTLTPCFPKIYSVQVPGIVAQGMPCHHSITKLSIQASPLATELLLGLLFASWLLTPEAESGTQA